MFSMTLGLLIHAAYRSLGLALGELKLGIWGLIINIIAFAWSLFELINIASYYLTTSPDALVGNLDSSSCIDIILIATTLSIL